MARIIRDGTYELLPYRTLEVDEIINKIEKNKIKLKAINFVVRKEKPIKIGEKE